MVEKICPFCLNSYDFARSFECPGCGESIPQTYILEYEEVVPLFLALVGFAQNGKTSYLNALSNILANIGEFWGGTSTRHLDEYTLMHFIEAFQGLESGNVPMATIRTINLRPMLTNLYNIPGIGSRCLVLYDLPGEIYQASLESPEDIENLMAPFKQVNTIWFLVSLPDFEAGNDTLLSLFNAYMSGLGQVGTQLSGKNVIMVYTKADHLFSILPDSVKDYLRSDPFAKTAADKKPTEPTQEVSFDGYVEKMREISTVLEKFTHDNVKGGKAFINLAKSTGIKVTYCVNSALGLASSDRMVERIQPLRIIDPLIWAIKLSIKKEIFISYSRRDWEEHVKPLVEMLQLEGFKVWIDQHLLEGGQDWLDEINSALQRCKVMILCVSPDALESRWVKMEYRFFIRENKPMLPLMCRSTTLPAELGGIQYLSPSEADMIVERLRKLTV